MTTPRTDNLRAALDGLRQQVEIGAATQTRESILRMLDKIAALAPPSPEPLDSAREFAERAEALVRAGTPDDAIVPLALTSIALSLAALAARLSEDS